jgi:hypothetical protein
LLQARYFSIFLNTITPSISVQIFSYIPFASALFPDLLIC